LDSAVVGDFKPEQFMPEKLPETLETAPRDADKETKQTNQEAAEKAQSERKKIQQKAEQDCRIAKRQAIAKMTLQQANNWKKSISEKLWKRNFNDFERCLADHEQGLKKIERDILESQKAFDKS